MGESNSNSWTRYVPYFGAVVGLAVGYGGTMLLSSQPSLSVGVAAMGALLGYLVARVVQMRGKLTMGLTAFGLPLLAAVACVGFMRLTPYIERQRTIDQMRASGIGFSARAPDEHGEWLRDRSGNMLPTWLAKWLGPECMAEVRTIDAKVAQLQRVDLEKLNNSKIFKVRLRRGGESPPLSRELVAWLGDCPELDSIRLELSYFSSEDAEALAELPDRYRIDFTIDAATATGHMGRLPKGSYAQFRGANLTVEHAKQVSELPSPRVVSLDFRQVAPGALRALEQLDHDTVLYVVSATLTQEDLVDLAKLGHSRLSLTSVVLPPELDEEQVESSIGTDELWVHQTQISLLQLQHLCQLFNCRSISVSGGVTEAEQEVIWSTTDLESLRFFDGAKWQKLMRP